ERTACQGEQAAEIVRYLQAVRQLQERRARDAKWSARDQAKADNLNAAALDRWVKYLEGNPSAAGLDAWRKLPKLGEAASEEQVRTAAMAFQQHVQTILAERGKGEVDKDKAALLQVLFGDKGVLALSDAELKARLPADKKQQMERMEQEAAKLRKEAPEK